MPHECPAIADIAALLAKAILRLAAHGDLPSGDSENTATTSREVA
ncbi:hypothetical protein [Rubinisphaera margarita]|nr:hypothetical protein [Rubinisphaera margarita]